MAGKTRSLGSAVLYLKSNADAMKKGLANGLKRIGAFSKAAGKAMVVAGAAITAGLAATVKSVANLGDQMDKMSKRTGFSTEALSELKHAAELSGTSIEALETGFKKMSRFIEDGRDGMKEYVDVFDKLGFEVREFDGLSPEQAFDKLAGALANVEDEMTRAALAQDIFGRAGTQLLPMLSDGADGLAAMRQEARDLGIVIDKEASVAGAKFNDDILRLKATLKAFGFTIGETLMPKINEYINRIREGLQPLRDWINAHPELTAKIVMIVGALGVLMTVLGPFLIMLPGIATAFAGIATVLSGPVVLAVGAVVAAAGLLYAAWVLSKDRIIQTWNILRDKFLAWKAEHQKQIDGFVAKLKEKLLPLWETIKVKFIEKWTEIKAWWDEHGEILQAAIIEKFEAVLNGVTLIMGYLTKRWEVTNGSMKSIWSEFLDFVVADAKRQLDRVLKMFQDLPKKTGNALMNFLYSEENVAARARNNASGVGFIDVDQIIGKIFSGKPAAPSSAAVAPAAAGAGGGITIQVMGDFVGTDEKVREIAFKIARLSQDGRV